VAEFREDKSQVVQLLNHMTKRIAEEIMVQLTPEEERLLSKSRTVDREAYDEYLRAQNYWGDASKESMQKALEYLNSAIEKEPEWAPLYFGLAQVWLLINQAGYEPPSVAGPKIFENLNRAIELDPELPDAHFLKGLIAHVVEWDWEKSEKEYLKALAVNPSDARSRILYAQLLCVLQRNDEAKMHGKLAYELDSEDQYMKVWYSAILPVFGETSKALKIAEEIVADDPGSYIGNNCILCPAYLCEEYDKVIEAEKYMLPIFNVTGDEIKEIEMIYREHGIVRAYEQIMIYLERYAENNPVSFMDMAIRYIIAKQPDKAMKWVEKGYESHDPQMTYITTKIYNLQALFSYPRFIEIVEDMKLT
jgi:tetratricopeptide (TPR) repeat protein